LGAGLEFTLPDGSKVNRDDPDCDARLSQALGRTVQLVNAGTGAEAQTSGSSYDGPTYDSPTYDIVWENPDAAPESVISASQGALSADGHPVSTVPAALLAPGTFQDVAPITILTTASLRAMQNEHPTGDWAGA